MTASGGGAGSAALRDRLGSFSGDVAVIANHSDVSEDELALVPSWWGETIGRSGREASIRAAHAWATLGAGHFRTIRELLLDVGEVYLARVRYPKHAGLALIYTIDEAVVRDGGGPESALWIGPPPRGGTVDSGQLGSGSAARVMNQFYDLVHDGLDARPTRGWASILAARDVEDWGSSSSQTDGDVEYFGWYPYQPRVSDLMLVWEEAAGGIAVLLDAANDEVWANASGELEYCGSENSLLAMTDPADVLFGRLQQRLLVNFR